MVWACAAPIEKLPLNGSAFILGSSVSFVTRKCHIAPTSHLAICVIRKSFEFCCENRKWLEQLIRRHLLREAVARQSGKLAEISI